MLGGGGGGHQPQYQPSGGYGNPQQNQGFQGSGGGDLLGGLLQTALDGLSKHVSHKIQKTITKKLTPNKMDHKESAY